MATGSARDEGELVPLTRALVEPHLGVLGRNPFTQAHIFTTASLSSLRLANLDALSEFVHLQHVHCGDNAIESLAPLRHLPLLLSIDASSNQLTEALDFDTPKCTPSHAWVDGGKWIGSLLRRAELSRNRIARMRDLSSSHQFLQELHLAHNQITAIEGVSRLRFLRVLDLSYNKLTSMRGLVDAEYMAPPDPTQPHQHNDDSSRGVPCKTLEALEKLVLNHNRIEAVDEVAFLPRLETLDLAHNSMKQLQSIGGCQRLQHLDLSHNDIEDVNELNHLIQLRYLQRLALAGGPLVEREGSFYRARVLRRLQQIEMLDEDTASAREKVKALVMHGSDVDARQRVFAKHLPGQQFTNFLPPLEFEDDVELERFLSAASGFEEQTPDDREREEA